MNNLNISTGLEPSATKSENVDIIDLILKSNEADFVGDSKSPPLKIVTAEMFFTAKNPGGPIDKTEWLMLTKTMSKSELVSHKTFLEKLAAGEKVDANPYEAIDGNGRSYVWASFRYKNGSQNFKILTTGGMCKFISMYQIGMIKVDFTLESLYAEALK